MSRFSREPIAEGSLMCPTVRFIDPAVKFFQSILCQLIDKEPDFANLKAYTPFFVKKFLHRPHGNSA